MVEFFRIVHDYVKLPATANGSEFVTDYVKPPATAGGSD
jgi:hypothetical protein